MSKRELIAMTTEEHRGLVVGANDSPGSLAALRYAAHEAERRGCGITLVHVTPSYVPVAPMRPLVPDDLEGAGRVVLSDARSLVAAQAPGVPVTTVLRSGATVSTLLSVADAADAIILGRETTPPVMSIVTEATTLGIAARATCPVVSVPDGWDPTTGPGRVVVGLKSKEHSGELLERAFEEAAGRGAGLVVLHATAHPDTDDAVVEPLLRDFRSLYHQVDVEVRMVKEEPARALIDATPDADLLVVVRRGHGFPSAARLGRSVRALLRAAACPVEVVAPKDLPLAIEDLELERAGYIEK